MRLSFRIFPVVAGILLSSCATQTNVQALPQEEVLNRAVLASQRLQSADFTVTGQARAQSGSVKSLSASFTLAGSLQSGGSVVSTGVDTTLTLVNHGTQTDVGLKGQITTLSPSETYVKVDSLTLKPDNPALMLPMQILLGKWWTLPPETGAAQGSRGIVPDQQLLKAQAEIITIEEDLGAQTLPTGPAYHYRVRLNRDKLAALLKARDPSHDPAEIRDVEAAGELWIDAATFYLTKAQWQITGLSTGAGPLNADVTISLGNHDHGRPVQAPADAQDLPFPMDGFATFGGNAPLPPGTDQGDTGR